MLRNTQLAKDVITSDDSNYRLSGKIEPMFYNEGTVNVNIYGFTVTPGNSFSAAFANSITNGTLSIQFENSTEPQSIKKVICVYGSPKTDNC